MAVLDDEHTVSRVITPLGWLPPQQSWQRLKAYPFGVKTLFVGYLGGFILSLVLDLVTWLIGSAPHSGPIPIYFELAIVLQLGVILSLWLIPMIGYPAAMVLLGLDILYQWLIVGATPGTLAFSFIIIEGVYLLYFLFSIPLLQFRLLEN